MLTEVEELPRVATVEVVDIFAVDEILRSDVKVFILAILSNDRFGLSEAEVGHCSCLCPRLVRSVKGLAPKVGVAGGSDESGAVEIEMAVEIAEERGEDERASGEGSGLVALTVGIEIVTVPEETVDVVYGHQHRILCAQL